MTRKFIYLINPISGTRSKAGLRELIEKEHQARELPLEILPTVIDGNYRFLKERIAREGITDIIVCGGDGSVNALAGSLLGSDINIGIIPLGSGNGLARSAGISCSVKKAIDNIFEGRAVAIDSCLINERFTCMLCGIGFDAKVAHEFARARKRGLATYVKLTFRNFIHAKTYPFVVKLNDREFSADAFFISIANSNQFGNEFKIAPRASLTDELLDIVIVKRMNKLNLLFSIFRQITGLNALQLQTALSHNENILYFQTDQLRISNPAAALMHIDGDPKETATEINIRLIPKAFKLIMP